jgi:DNA polymerase III delta prime subunit
MLAADNPLIPKFQRALRNLSLDPLIMEKQVREFRVEYGRDTLAKLDSLIRDSDTQDSKIMFSGHRGCGKSTLLANLAKQLSDDYFVTFFSISDTIEMSDVDHVNILFATGLNMLATASGEGIEIPKATQESLVKWFAKRTRVDTDSLGFKGVFGIDLWKVFVAQVQTEKTIRNEIKSEFERNITELVAKINEIAATISHQSKRKPVVIIDDLDKLDLSVIKQIFLDNIKSLFLPHFTIVYTMPVSALRDTRILGTLTTETDDSIIELAVSKIYAKGDRQNHPDAYQKPVVDRLVEILTKRLQDDLILVEEIVEPALMPDIALASGGVLRELMRIAIRGCRICLTQLRQDPIRTDIRIDRQILTEACKDLRLDFERPLGESDYQILEIIHKSNLPQDGQSQKFLDLLHGLYVLEYRNDETWYDLHPIVIDLLQRKGLI